MVNWVVGDYVGISVHFLQFLWFTGLKVSTLAYQYRKIRRIHLRNSFWNNTHNISLSHIISVQTEKTLEQFRLRINGKIYDGYLCTFFFFYFSNINAVFYTGDCPDIWNILQAYIFQVVTTHLSQYLDYLGSSQFCKGHNMCIFINFS